MPWLVLAALGAGACGQGRAVSHDAPPSGIVGTWRVIKFCDDRETTGELYDPFGPTPSGYFIYAPGGQLSIQMADAGHIRPFASGDDFAPTAQESRAVLAAYMGYYGTYTVTSESTVVHHVRGGTVPSYIGTDQQRVYRIRGDSLTLGGSPRTWPCRVLVRER